MAGFRDHGSIRFDLMIEYRAGNLEVDRTERTVERLARSHRYEIRNAQRRGHARREFGDRSQHLDVGKILQSTHTMLREPGLAANEQHRTLGAKCIGHAGDCIRRSRSSGDHRAAQVPGHASITVGSMCRDLFVAHVDDLDPFVDAAIVDIDDMATAQREDRIDAFRLQRFRDKMTARDLLHRCRDVDCGGLTRNRKRLRHERPFQTRELLNIVNVRGNVRRQT